jgi:hypothetical protein
MDMRQDSPELPINERHIVNRISSSSPKTKINTVHDFRSRNSVNHQTISPVDHKIGNLKISSVIAKTYPTFGQLDSLHGNYPIEGTKKKKPRRRYANIWNQGRIKTIGGDDTKSIENTQNSPKNSLRK